MAKDIKGAGVTTSLFFACGKNQSGENKKKRIIVYPIYTNTPITPQDNTPVNTESPQTNTTERERLFN